MIERGRTSDNGRSQPEQGMTRLHAVTSAPTARHTKDREKREKRVFS